MRVCLFFLVDFLEYNDDRSPWETVEEKLDEIRFTTVYFVAVVIHFQSSVYSNK